jgi:hypothetical protein
MPMKSTTPILIGAISLLVLLAGVGIYAYTANRRGTADTGAVPGTSGSVSGPASIKYLAIQKPNFVVRGENLSRVEMWATIKGKQQLLGALTRQSTPPVAGMGDTWTMPIPAHIGASGIYVRGYDAAGNAVARLDFSLAEIRGL